jgi:acylphosphatase
MQKTIELIISGKVQGVWFRHHTRETAQDLGINGTVENLDNGTVRIVATGTDEQLQKLREWCKTGSPLSRVDAVQYTILPYTSFDSFS